MKSRFTKENDYTLKLFMNEETFECLALQTDGMLCLLASTSRPAFTIRPSQKLVR